MIGHVVLTSNGISITDCAKYGEESGAEVIQIFINSPQSFRANRDSSELEKLCIDAEKRNIKILVHGNFMLNFCNPLESYIYKNACTTLIKELNQSVLLNAIGVVIHMGKNVKKLNITDEEAINRYINGLKYCLDNSNKQSILILETGAGVGTEICTDIHSLGFIKHELREYGDRVKFCIDTCHIFAAGYNIGEPEYVKFLDKYIQNTLNWDNVVAVHFNDSKTPLNSRKDRHADIGKGCINFDGLIEFAKLCKKYKIPTILETPSEVHDKKKFTYFEQMNIIKKNIQ